ncbi:MAG: hypothetical protein V7765_04085 [Oleispira sp.]
MAVLITCDGVFLDDRTGYSVIFDDDGRIAYAYLLDSNGSIVSDVWLYNRCNTIDEPEWKAQGNMPFSNPKAYVNSAAHDVFQLIDNISDVKVNWGGRAGNVIADIFVRQCLFAKLVEGVKPGYSLLAGKDGPLAKVLEL